MKKNYKYLGRGADSEYIPEGWVPKVEEMLSKIDKIERLFFVPRILLNAIYGKKGIKDIEIEQIKEKFAGLRVYFSGNGNQEKFDAISKVISQTVKDCDSICQDCGSTKDAQHSIYGYNGRWIKNLCSKCRDEQKYVTTASAKKYRETKPEGVYKTEVDKALTVTPKKKAIVTKKPVRDIGPINEKPIPTPMSIPTVPKSERAPLAEGTSKKKKNKNH